MISKWHWLALQFSRRMWLRVGLFSLLSAAAALIGIVIQPIIPPGLSARIGADAVDHILNILASSMLAVTTFSLSVMVAAYGAATNNVTPRATKLLMDDTTTQNVLAVFLGAFLYSLVGIAASSTGAYGQDDHVVLFIVTVGVIVLIVGTILRWIEHLTRLGRVGETTERVEDVTAKALRARQTHPCLGGRPLLGAVPPGARPIHASRIGYVQHVDIKALQDVAEELGEKGHPGEVFLAVLPGTFLHPARPLAFVLGPAEVDVAEVDVSDRLRAALSVGDERSFDQDPRFGLSVLSEIASRALSPAVNDPGTAIDVIGRAVRLLALWRDVELHESKEKVPAPNVQACNVWVPPLHLADMFDDIFTPIARDGAGLVEVGIRLQKALAALAEMGDGDFRREARRHAALAFARADKAFTIEADRELLKAAMLPPD